MSARPRATTARQAPLHPLRGADAEQAKAVAQHLAGSVVEPQARAVKVGDLFVAERRHASAVIPAVIRRGDRLEVARDAVLLAELDGLGDDARELAEHA